MNYMTVMAATTYLTMACVVVFAIIAIVYFYRLFFKSGSSSRREPGYKAAGRQGEVRAKGVISKALRDGDAYYNNVSLEYNGKRTELDNLIINKRGVFIVEVKNYSGRLYGAENDDQWGKIKTTDGGNQYVKYVRNPLKQADRQVYILSQIFKYYGINNVWIEGLAYLVERNAPCRSERILESVGDVDRRIHNGINNRISERELQKILAIFN